MASRPVPTTPAAGGKAQAADPRGTHPPPVGRETPPRDPAPIITSTRLLVCSVLITRCNLQAGRVTPPAGPGALLSSRGGRTHGHPDVSLGDPARCPGTTPPSSRRAAAAEERFKYVRPAGPAGTGGRSGPDAEGREEPKHMC